MACDDLSLYTLVGHEFTACIMRLLPLAKTRCKLMLAIILNA